MLDWRGAMRRRRMCVGATTRWSRCSRAPRRCSPPPSTRRTARARRPSRAARCATRLQSAGATPAPPPPAPATSSSPRAMHLQCEPAPSLLPALMLQRGGAEGTLARAILRSLEPASSTTSVKSILHAVRFHPLLHARRPARMPSPQLLPGSTPYS
eukprot:6205538-Pleurochrysis_carterae.AAC.10